MRIPNALGINIGMYIPKPIEQFQSTGAVLKSVKSTFAPQRDGSILSYTLKRVDDGPTRILKRK